MANRSLDDARKAKNDEFYTQFHDIEKEMNAYLEYNPEVFKDKTLLLPCDDPEWSNFTRYFAQNFEKLQLKKLISTSYAPNSKPREIPYQPTLFEIDSPDFDETKTVSNGKIFTLSHDRTGDKNINVEDLEWEYLEGDGDFRSDEVKALRDEADVIITNPPFSLLRDFLAWIVEAKKEFALIGNMNAITYKEVFPLIEGNRLWLGATNFNEGMYFAVPDSWKYSASYKFEREKNGKKVSRVPGVCWFTNLEHGRRHQPLPLMTEADNIKFSKHKQVKDVGYQRYFNFDGIEVPYSDAIPSDYAGLMGVPITFLGKYSPEQFEIVGWNGDLGVSMHTLAPKGSFEQGGPSFYVDNGDGSYRRLYTRVVIRHRR